MAIAARAGVITFLNSTINRGAPLYNAGLVEECERLYKSVACMILRRACEGGGPHVHTHAHFVISEAEATALADATRAAGDASARAWALRHAFDLILANGLESDRARHTLPCHAADRTSPCCVCVACVCVAWRSWQRPTCSLALYPCARARVA